MTTETEKRACIAKAFKTNVQMIGDRVGESLGEHMLRMGWEVPAEGEGAKPFMVGMMLVDLMVYARCHGVDFEEELESARVVLAEVYDDRDFGDDDGCPHGDPDCLGGNGDRHDACSTFAERELPDAMGSQSDLAARAADALEKKS